MIDTIAKKILLSDDCYATTALAIFVSRYGLAALDWFPGTIIKTLEKDYGDVPITTINKLMTGIEILTKDSYYKELDKFINFTNFLNHGTPDDYVADVSEIAWGLTEANLIDPLPPIKNPLEILSNEVYTYILALFENGGLVTTPDAFKIVGIFIDKKDDVLATFSDIPELYAGLYQTAQFRKGLVESYVDGKLNELLVQLAQVGFGSHSELVQALLNPTKS